MLMQPDSHELGDKRLNYEEAGLKKKEEILRQASVYKIKNQDELADPNRSAGPRLYYTDIIVRLRRLCPRLLVKEGSAGSVALYVPKTRQELVSQAPENRLSKHDWHNDSKYVGGLEKDWMPEFSHVTTDTSEVAHKEIRGWRGVVIALVKQGTISYAGAVREFGAPFGPRASVWNEELQKYK